MSFQVLLQPVMFDDWIWDIRWLAPDDGSFDPLDEKCMNVAICFGHNGVSLWDWKSKERLAWAVCTESCILYAGHFVGSTWNSLMVAVGTVFKEVILWAPSQCLAQAPARVVHRLSGHQGVIFSVNFNVPRRLLCSTSDDRSLRVYRFHEHPSLCQAGAEDLSLEQLSRGWFSSLHVLYGHESRVWRAAALSSCYISVGEDSSICFWGTPGNLITKMTAPGGGSIWCLAVNEDETLAVTGSSGSAVCIWHLSDVLGHASKTTWIEAFTVGSNFPRNLALVDCFGTMSLLVVTNEGCVFSSVCPPSLMGRMGLFSFYFCQHYTFDKDLGRRCKYVLLPKVSLRCAVTFGNDIEGARPSVGKIRALDSLIQSNHFRQRFLSVSTNDMVQSIDSLRQTEQVISVRKMPSYVFFLLNAPNRWETLKVRVKTTSWRKIFIKRKTSRENAKTTARNRHICASYEAWNPIQGIILARDISSTDVLVSRSRFRVFSLVWAALYSANTLWCIFSIKFAKIELTRGKTDLSFCLFILKQATRSRRFAAAVCNGSLEKTLIRASSSISVSFFCLCLLCFFISRVKAGPIQRHFMHVKDRSHICNRRTMSRTTSRTTLKTTSRTTSGTTSSTTSKTISRMTSRTTSRTTSRMNSKTTSRTTSRTTMSWSFQPPKRLLFIHVGEARGVMWCSDKARHVALPGSSESEELLHHCLWSLDKGCQRNFKAFPAKDPLARYMDVSIWEEAPLEFRIATVASDTYLRVFGYSWKEDLTLLVSIAVGEHCLFKVLRTELVTRPKSSLLLTAGNDGMLRFWELRGADEKDEGRTECRLLDTFRRHQSGINALDILVHDNIFTVVSGGDDNSLIVTNSVITEEGAVSELDEMTVANAHDAQITG
ncbi:unnamed protein product, partial [Ixodes persulcatus]